VHVIVPSRRRPRGRPTRRQPAPLRAASRARIAGRHYQYV